MPGIDTHNNKDNGLSNTSMQVVTKDRLELRITLPFSVSYDQAITLKSFEYAN